MTMTDKKNSKKEKRENEQKSTDDLFDDLNDVLKEYEESQFKTEELKVEEKKHSTHVKLDSRPASQTNITTKENMIWLPNKTGKIFTIDEISPEDFAWWCNDKLPGMKEIQAKTVQTPQHRRDLFEEVIAILEHWLKIAQEKTPSRNNIF